MMAVTIGLARNAGFGCQTWVNWARPDLREPRVSNHPMATQWQPGRTPLATHPVAPAQLDRGADRTHEGGWTDGPQLAQGHCRRCYACDPVRGWPEPAPAAVSDHQFFAPRSAGCNGSVPVTPVVHASSPRRRQCRTCPVMPLTAFSPILQVRLLQSRKRRLGPRGGTRHQSPRRERAAEEPARLSQDPGAHRTGRHCPLT